MVNAACLFRSDCDHSSARLRAGPSSKPALKLSLPTTRVPLAEAGTPISWFGIPTRWQISLPWAELHDAAEVGTQRSNQMRNHLPRDRGPTRRRHFIGGSDARIIMGDDEAALIRLWQEKRGEVEPEDLSRNLPVQLGLVTEELNRRWYEANTGEVIADIQKQVRHPTVRWLAATPDGRVQSEWRSVRVEIHAALVFLGRGGRSEIHAAAPT